MNSQADVECILSYQQHDRLFGGLVSTMCWRQTQVRRTRRIARCFPRDGEDWPSFGASAALRHSSSGDSGIQRWDHVVCASWWRWAWHAARLAETEPHRWIAKLLSQHDACWRHGPMFACGHEGHRHAPQTRQVARDTTLGRSDPCRGSQTVRSTMGKVWLRTGRLGENLKHYS